MYYHINNDSLLSFAEQIAQCDCYSYLSHAKEVADRRKAKTGDNWEVIQTTSVYTTQTLGEAHRAALDVPHMARD